MAKKSKGFVISSWLVSNFRVSVIAIAARALDPNVASDTWQETWIWPRTYCSERLLLLSFHKSHLGCTDVFIVQEDWKYLSHIIFFTWYISTVKRLNHSITKQSQPLTNFSFESLCKFTNTLHRFGVFFQTYTYSQFKVLLICKYTVLFK